MKESSVDPGLSRRAQGHFTLVDGGTLHFDRTERIVEANVTATSSTAVELLGPDGVLVTANFATQFQDNSDAKLKVMTLADIGVGTICR